MLELRLLRKVSGLSEKAVKALHGQLEANIILADKQNPPLAAQLRALQRLSGYVDNDLPRDVWLTDEIMRCTVGFHLADPNGTLVKNGDFDNLAEAEAARRGAVIDFSHVNVKLPKPVDTNPLPELVGPPSQRRAAV